jgi:hypothetical protein
MKATNQRVDRDVFVKTWEAEERRRKTSNVSHKDLRCLKGAKESEREKEEEDDDDEGQNERQRSRYVN